MKYKITIAALVLAVGAQAALACKDCPKAAAITTQSVIQSTNTVSNLLPLVVPTVPTTQRITSVVPRSHVVTEMVEHTQQVTELVPQTREVKTLVPESRVVTENVEETRDVTTYSTLGTTGYSTLATTGYYQTLGYTTNTVQAQEIGFRANMANRRAQRNVRGGVNVAVGVAPAAAVPLGVQTLGVQPLGTAVVVPPRGGRVVQPRRAFRF